MAAPSSGVVSLRSSVFLDTANARYRGSLVLVQIDLPATGVAPAKTLRLTNATGPTGKWYVDPDGYPWVPVLIASPSIDHGGSWLQVGPQPVDVTLEIFDARLSGVSRFSSLFATYPFIGARVQILQAFDNLTSTSEFEPLFTGVVAERDRLDLSGIALHCVEDRSWSTMIPPRVVTVDEFPDAPSQVKGAAIQIVLGDWETGNRYLDSDGYSGSIETVIAGIARGACPMMVIKAPTASGVSLPRAIISDDEIDIGSLSGGAPYDQVYMYDQTLDTIVGQGLGTLSNPADGPADITLLSTQVLGAIMPNEDANPALGATGVAELLRKDKDLALSGYASLDFTNNLRIARVNMPDVAPAGKFISATAYLFYSHNLWTGTAGRFIVNNSELVKSDSVALPTGNTGMAATGFEAVQALAITKTGVNAVIRDWGDIKNCYIQADVRASGQLMKVHRMVLVVTYEMAARIERPGTQRTTRHYVFRDPNATGNNALALYKSTDSTSPDLVAFDSPLLGFPRGRKDTAAGIYTGTPGALIEHPVDMVRYLLKRWCGVSASEIVENSGDFGAFPDAKTATSDYKFRTIISSRAEAADHIAAIGAESLIWFKRCPTLAGAPWVAVPWELGSPVDYRSSSEPFTFYRARNHVVEDSFSVGETKISLVANTVRVNYDWDPRTNTYGDQVYITPTASRICVIGSTFGSDSTRESQAADSAALYGGTHATPSEVVLSLRMVKNALTATRILSRLFDLRVTTKLVVRFKTFVNAYDLNRGHVISFASDWDERVAYPKPGTDGSWAGKAFRVTRVKRLRESPAEYDVEAVEV